MYTVWFFLYFTFFPFLKCLDGYILSVTNVTITVLYAVPVPLT